jgi:putative radical SAM enzyme (TIGR03279 family)
MKESCVIQDVEKGGIAENAGIKPGDILLKIDKTPISDVIDLMFCSSDSIRSIQFIHKGRKGAVRIPLSARSHPLGIKINDFRPRSCNNRCVFCFVHQLPPGLRKSLYFKDEDYRLSFLCGNYITAANLSEKDIRRIISQRLSPLYISVHATDRKLRMKLLGNDKIPDILPLLHRFKRQDIRFHVQIVLIPGWNDGKALQETLCDLESLHPALLSVAIVPVGLTAHRKNLPVLQPVTREYAREFLNIMKSRRERLEESYGRNFLFLSDEFYLLAGRRPPAYSQYDDIPQLENGVGMVADFYRGFASALRRLPLKIRPARKAALVTGLLGKKVLERFAKRLNTINGLDLQILVVPSKLLGEGITVSGLMAGRDIIDVLRNHPGFDRYILPENCLNPDGVFLDDLTPSDIQKKTGCHIVVASGRASDLIPYLVGKTGI